MDVKEAIKKRRAHRSLDPVEVDDRLIKDLAEHAALSPSCFNKQPWRFVFVHDPAVLKQLHSGLPDGNRWATLGSMIIAVFSQKEDDCLIKEREYYLFDTGMATAFILLRATELGLVAHPIAGFKEQKVKEILHIPQEYRLITLIIMGQKSDTIHDLLNEKQVEGEKERPPRLPFEQFAYMNRYHR
jgi:nitroreductase